MKHFKLKNFLFAIIATAALSSCHKDKNDVTPTTPTAQVAGVYVLNQGGSTGSITYYDYTTKVTTPDVFTTANGKGVGNLPNDLKIYGSKMYIVVDKSKVINVVNPKTAKLITQISFGDSEPRSIAFYKNNAFVTSYDGTVAVIDTAALTISKHITVGSYPEQLVVSNGKLYVANSGGLAVTYDKTVSVIDLSTLAVTKTINVIINPVAIAADNYGHVYVISNGDYNTVLPGISIIDNTTDATISQTTVDVGYGSPFIVSGDNGYYLSSGGKVVVYNTKTQAISSANFITDGTKVTTAYGLNANSTTGEVFVTDAKDYVSNGSLYAFDKTGKIEYTITVGINPANIVFVNK
jgi:YVTN family beta-propeller protein